MTRLVLSSAGAARSVMAKAVPFGFSPSCSVTSTSFPLYAVSFVFVGLQQKMCTFQGFYVAECNLHRLFRHVAACPLQQAFATGLCANQLRALHVLGMVHRSSQWFVSPHNKADVAGARVPVGVALQFGFQLFHAISACRAQSIMRTRV